MRRLKSQIQAEKEKKRNQMIIGIVLIALMGLGTLGYGFTSRVDDTSVSATTTYRGVEFIESNGLYYFQAKGINFISTNHPKTLENIEIDVDKKLWEYQNKDLYFAGDLYGPAYAMLGQNFYNVVIRIQEEDVCVNNLTLNCSIDAPTKSCLQDNIFILEETLDDEQIYQEDNCVFIKTSYENQTKYADVILYKILDIL